MTIARIPRAAGALVRSLDMSARFRITIDLEAYRASVLVPVYNAAVPVAAVDGREHAVGVAPASPRRANARRRARDISGRLRNGAGGRSFVAADPVQVGSRDYR